MSKRPESLNPWDWLQPHDVERFGNVILDPKERNRWCKATIIGGLPYLWQVKGSSFRDRAYAELAGESIESCHFEQDIRTQVGGHGRVHCIDIIERARTSTASGLRGGGGRLGTWRYEYSNDMPDASFDRIAVLQAVQHADDWRECAEDLLRILKPGGRIVLAEIGFSPTLRQAAATDLHLEYWVDKLYAGSGMKGPEDVSYYSPDELLAAFSGLVDDPGTFTWRGADLFWGTKPVGPAEPGHGNQL
jgi:SAM-dependent methyltransferase